eukprot:TRINITY_DN34822_c0_g1_i1.p1 TRINITY_DN34822_c0_g1~~TRINITY_DN34822_c0_g1_i1.p1  ORF type:complete len:173 (+),score=33.90 TRINITY_DN34822_c0_g1_i1:36-521(+)
MQNKRKTLNEVEKRWRKVVMQLGSESKMKYARNQVTYKNWAKKQAMDRRMVFSKEINVVRSNAMLNVDLEYRTNNLLDDVLSAKLHVETDATATLVRISQRPSRRLPTLPRNKVEELKLNLAKLHATLTSSDREVLQKLRLNQAKNKLAPITLTRGLMKDS